MATVTGPSFTSGRAPATLLTSTSYRTNSHPPATGYDFQQPSQRSTGRPHSAASGTSVSTADRESLTLLNTLANSQPTSHEAVPPEPSSTAMGDASRSGRFNEEWDASQRGSSIIDGASPTTPGMQRSNSFSGSATGEGSGGPSRGNMLKKKSSLRRSGSLKRSSSRRSMIAGSVRSLALQSGADEDEMHSAFYCPVPTSGNPTETLANRFQAWRKTLKDLITYFREIQNHYEQRGKSLLKLSNVLNNTTTPLGFQAPGGLDEALHILGSYNKQAVVEANKAREIEEDVILALTGLRSDLQQKVKEIKNLSGDFKNSVDKEMESTRRAVNALQGTLGQSDLDPSLTTGKQDPYLLRLAVDRQREKQIDEENSLHQAYINLENSGRELESIVVGEIQKSYNAYAGILKRESDAAYTAVEELRVGPISMPKDQEWTAFVQKDKQFVDPDMPIRSAESIQYPGRDHYAAQEVRAGLLERKSKYLKSYTAGWYVLSPTHLHEFKSADKTQAPITSLYLPEQKLGSHSAQGGSSNKFILKGRQTGGMHRGHTWVFRAESHDTMMAWYEDIKALTEKSPQERSDYVRGHSRSFSRSSQHSFSSDGVVDEDDDEPFAAGVTVTNQPEQEATSLAMRRPKAGGRFPSDLQVNAQRGLQAPLSPSSVSSGNNKTNQDDRSDHEVLAAAGALPGSEFPPQFATARETNAQDWLSTGNPAEQVPSHAAVIRHDAEEDGVNPYTNEPAPHGLSKQPDVSEKIVVQGSAASSSSVPAAQPKPVAGGQQATERTHPGDSCGEQTATAQAAYFSDARNDEPGGDLYPQSNVEVEGVRRTPHGGISPSTAQDTMDIPTRPAIAHSRTDSTPTISNLHIPGEYPRFARS